jgi:hypothetical protein
MIAVPCSAPVTKPAELTAATVEFELDHVTLVAGVLPAASVVLADACTEVPDAIGFVGMVIDREEEGPVLEPPPQAARVRQSAAPIAETVRMWRSPYGSFTFQRAADPLVPTTSRTPACGSLRPRPSDRRAPRRLPSMRTL